MLKKGALSLLSQYGGDSSDDDVPGGPRVSTKRPFKDEEYSVSNKKRLPVPEILLKDSMDVDEHIDDPNVHGGRIRTFAHERGNWATFVYIQLNQDEGVKDLIQEILNCTPSNINLTPLEDFHISLTKTVILKHHWITPFTESIKIRTTYFKKFIILFNNLKIYCNEERTRTFIGLQIKTGYDSLIKLVEVLNECLEEFKLPTFYDNPSFHVSIMSCVGDYEEQLTQLIPEMNYKLHELMDNSDQHNWYIYVNNLLCKTGNKYFKFDLN